MNLFLSIFILLNKSYCTRISIILWHGQVCNIPEHFQIDPAYLIWLAAGGQGGGGQLGEGGGGGGLGLGRSLPTGGAGSR